jgi:hypothetical protein
MIRTRLALAVMILLACSLFHLHTQGAVVAHISATDSAAKGSATVATPGRVDAARRQRAGQEPRRLNVGDSARSIDQQKQSAATSSTRRKVQPPSSTEDDSTALEAPLTTTSPTDDPPQELQLSQPLTADEQREETDEQPALDEPVAGAPDQATGQQQPSDEPATTDEDPAASEEPAPAPAPPAKEFSPEMTRLRNKIRTCLSYYYQRPTNINDRSPWGVMHSLISFGVDTELIANGKRVNAIGWICYNRPCKGMTLLTVKNGKLTPRGGPGYQGHEGQLLSMLALSRVPTTYPIRVEGRDFTVADLVKIEQQRCRAKSELSFQLIGLAHYLDSDATWENDQGQKWSIPRMIREELAQPINGVACGGTHRLIGLSMAVKTRVKRGEPLDGEWLRAHKFVTAYQKYAFKLQNSDGSFSTKWLESREASGDIERRMQTTGHILEWLIFSLPEKDLSDPRLVKSVNYLTTLLLNNRSEDWEIGPRGHALRALVLYNDRVFGDKPGELRALLARRPGK